MPRRGTRGRHRSARESVILAEASVAAIVCCLFGLLLHLLQQHQAACQVLASNNNNRIYRLKPSYVFPSNHQQQQRPLQATSGQQISQQRQHAIYINPNPSTRSAGFHQQMQQRHRLVAANVPHGNNQTKRAAIASNDGGQMQTNSMLPDDAAAAAGASAIGHQVLSQVAEWPFYKSLQTARKTNTDRYQQHNGFTGDSFRPQKLARQQYQLSLNTLAPQQPSVVVFGDELVTRPVVAESTETTTTTTMAPTTTMPAQTTTTTTNASPTTTTTTTTSEPSSQDQSDPNQASSTTAKRNERGSESSTSTTPNSIMDSSQAASATDQPPQSTSSASASTTMAPKSITPSVDQDPLFSPNFHSSIQQAINRIVKMTTESSSAKADGSSNKLSTPVVAAAVAAKPASDPSGSPTVATSGGHHSVRSSLSLNVLLKNFGVHNLTNLDQILLKSTLMNDTDTRRDHHHSNEISSVGHDSLADQKIEIIGLRNLQQPKVVSSESSDSDDQMAECKIEYTMKHVNISLMNGGKGDYTCDYIIDRKMAANSGGVSLIQPTKLDIRKVCKLQLTSKFFSDRVEESKTLDSEPANCNGTYLAVGLLRFCYLSPQVLASEGGEERTLNRVFHFPIERDMFDMKMVHKKTTRRRDQAQQKQRQVGEDSGGGANEIHLEIRPLIDKDCASAQMGPLPATGDDDKSSASSLLEHEEPSSVLSTLSQTTRPKKHPPPTNPMRTNVHVRPTNDVGVEYELPSASAGDLGADHRPSSQQMLTGGSTGTSAPTTTSTTTKSSSTTSSPIGGEDADSPETANAADGSSGDSSSPLPASANRESRNRDGSGQNINRHQPVAAAKAGDQYSGSQLGSRDAHRAKPTVQPKRKFVFKLPHDKQLHPLNNRFKVSQSFDVTSAPRHYYPGGSADSPTTTAAGGEVSRKDADTSEQPKRNLAAESGDLCDGFEHISTVGQLMSPDYPRYYPANVNCSFIIKQTASNFCQLLLHFRDFDLINTEQSLHAQRQANQQQQQHCPDDYLQVGETRYCNKYAMVGHKMRLDFPPSYLAGASISLSFRSDHMQSGRGFLIKYQQVPCSSDSDSVSSLSVAGGGGQDHLARSQGLKQRQSMTSTTLIGDLVVGAPQQVDGHTIAPPLQQPDFSLALKTTPSSNSQRSHALETETNGSGNTTSEASGPKASKGRQQASTASGNNRPEETRTKDTAAHLSSQSNLSQVKFNEKIMGSTSSKRNRQDTVSNSTMAPGAQQLMTLASTVSSPSLASLSQQQQRPLVQDNHDSGQDEVHPTATTAQQCNQVNNEQSFILRSFNYPDDYANNLQCLFYVRRNTSQVCYLELTFIRFELEADADCRYDYLEINNIRLCGSLKDLPHKTTRIYFFNEPIKMIKFRSDDSGSKQGFLIRVDQLECGPNGSILRQSKALPDLFDNGQKLSVSSEQQQEQQQQQSAEFNVHSFNNNSGVQDLSPGSKDSFILLPPAPVVHRPTTGSGGQVISQRSNSSHSPRTFQYDSASALAGASRRSDPMVAISSPQALPPSSSSSSASDNKTQSDSSFACGGLFEGNEATIKSPLWPESYTNDESLGTCRYTIVRNQAVKNKICQLELRFVSLRLDVSDCIDVDGYELLCGFNTRNMVKYYPFDRQSHLTITFFTGAGKFARSLSSQLQQSRQQKSDLLPSRAPFRFMIKAKQHECIDGFLAPQTESIGQDSQSTGGGGAGYNHTNLLYSGHGGLRYANRTTTIDLNLGSKQSPSSSDTSAPSARKRLPPVPTAATTTGGQSDSMLKYDFSNSAPSAAGNKRPNSKGPTLMYSLIAGHMSSAVNNSLSSSQPPPTSSSPVGLFSGCLDGAITKTSDQLFSANYPLKYGANLHCALTVSRESVAICYLELEFLDMDLDSLQSRFCESDYFQINYAERYCSMEQVESRLGAKRLLLVPFELSNNDKITLLFHSDQFNSGRGFLLRYRQVPCSTSNTHQYLATPSLGGHHHQLSLDSSSNPESKLIDRMPLLGSGQSSKQQSPQTRTSPADLAPSSVANFDQRSQPTTTGSDQLRCLIQFSQYNGILSSTNILSKLKTNFPFRNDCEIRLKLLPGFCQVQLTFGEFELAPRLGVDYCLELLELNGVQYCGDELKNASRLLSISDLSQRTVQIRYVGSNSSYFNGFRAIFKQIECQPEPLKQVAAEGSDNSSGRRRQQADQWPLGREASRKQQPNEGATRDSVNQPQQQQVEFKEIIIRNEFFELNSFKLSKSTSRYDANMFVVYRLKKISPDVCKLRLMFYKFDLEASLGCKRDFLDVNNVDRLCGQLGKPEETRRDYDWQNERDFLISFVSDASLEREGFLLFGQQLHSANCSDISPQQQAIQIQQPTFDEALEPKTSSATTTMAPEVQPPAPIFVKVGHHHGQTQHQNQAGDSAGGEAQEHNPDGLLKPQSIVGSNNCYKLFYESKFDLSSPNWPQKYSPKTTCYYLIHKSQQDLANCKSSVTFNVVSMILGPEEMPDGEGDSIGAECDTSTKDYLDIDGRILCGLISRPRVINVDFGLRQFVTVKFSSNSANGFGFFIEANQNNKCPQPLVSDQTKTDRQPQPEQLLVGNRDNLAAAGGSGDDDQTLRGGQRMPQGAEASSSCNQLLTHEVNLIESENLPQHYPHSQDCLYALRRTNQSTCAIDVIMSHFDLEEPSAASGNCETDYLEIDYSRFCGSYPPKHRLRFNYFSDELDKYIKFHSDASISRTGFSLTVRQVTNCVGSLPYSSSQSATSNQQQHLTPQPKGNSQASQPDNDELINYLPDSSTATNLAFSSVADQKPPATTPKPPTVAGNVNGSGSIQPTPTDAGADDHELSLAALKEFSTLCQFVYHKERQYLVSPNYNEHKRSYDNNVDCLYKIAAKGYEFCSLKLTILDLDLEVSSECQNDYLLIDNRRYCSPPQNNDNKTARQPDDSGGASDHQHNQSEVLEVLFAETLPREIHLLYHTNAHINEGRGFKLFYEQQPCRRFDETAGGDSGSEANHKSLTSMRSINPTSSSSPASSGPEEREARRMKLGQLSYPRNYVTSQSASTGRAQTGQIKRAQYQGNQAVGSVLELPAASAQHHHHRDSQQQQPASSSSRELLWQHQSATASKQQQPNHQRQAGDLDQQHGDLTLRKEIVVAKSTPLIMVR